MVDLVISDWAMPHMSGLSFLKAVREDDKLDPNNENLYYNLSRAYYQGQDFGMAPKALVKALNLRPDFHEAREMLHRAQNETLAAGS